MFEFEQPKLKIGIAYTSRDTWVNKETEANRKAIIEKVSLLAEAQHIDVYSTEDLEVRRKKFMLAGRELKRSNHRYLSDYEDAIFAASYFKEKEVDALFIPFCNFGQEEAVAKLGKDLNVPLLIWGPRDEIPNPTATYRPTDSQCGIFAASKALRRYGVKFTYIENCAINDVIFENGFNSFIETARIVRTFRHARIAQISVRPQQFLNLMVNEGELLEKFNIEIVPITGTQLIDTINIIQKKEGDQIDALLADIEKKIDLSQLQNKRLIAAIELGIMKIAHQYNCNAVASDCWHTINREFGVGPWFVFGDLYDRGLPCTNECDIHGAITSLLAIGAGNNKSAAFFTDLAMRHPENNNAELLWHMGFAPSLKDPDVNGYVIKTGEGHYRLKTGDLTILRFDGDHGNYSCFVGKGESIHGPETGGNYTYLQVEDWSKWEKKFVYGPYVHHVVGIFGDYRDEMLDACRYLEIKYDTPDSNLFI
jgi:L-fucose isomerase-like protein